VSGDYTRFTFKPKKDYSAVVKQQGRVDLDADFNELIEIMDRRWRSETIDIIGCCTVPNSTPDAFLVTPTALGDFDIGIGRMYVDGIQVENHGLLPDRYLRRLGELEGTLPVLYSDQPYLPAPLPPHLAATSGTTDLVYIDVWEREVNVLEDPSIREVALGGPDTTNRIQSVWQVRVLQDVGDHSCGDDIARWDQTVAPSAGRLTTTAVAPPAADDPCIIAPSGGYRGLENRLYRVEIHSEGTIGGGAPAKFKWSRNNASVASSVTAIPITTQITVQQIGRDRVLRFEIGNWIEITDDFREFQGLAGHMAQITAIDEANRILTFAPAIPGVFNFNPADPSRHTRVTRWDQTQNVDANGLLDVVAGPIDIEDGIRVTFSLDPAGGNFKIADYWCFAARTADGSVEILQNAPPRGILHHFCRLAFIHWGNTVETATVIDCRHHWPAGDCDCCTVTVGDGVDSHGQFTDIQQAIDALGDRGGLVCIGRGFYTVRTTLRLDNTKRNVIIRGMGPATRIAFVPREDAGVFIEIIRTDHVSLEDVFVVTSRALALVSIGQSQFCRISGCTLVNVPGEEVRESPTGIAFLANCGHCEIVHNAIIAAKAVTCVKGQVSELLIQDNLTLCTQSSISIIKARGLEVLHNQLRGLPLKAFPDGVGLTRATIDAFQNQVTSLFLAATSLASFQAVGVLVYSGNGVVIRANLILAQVGVLGFLFINSQMEQNEILSLVGLLTIFALIVRIEDNLVFGLYAGAVQSGITAVIDYTANEWIGLYGILWLSLRELLSGFGKLLGGALNALAFSGAGPSVVNMVTKLGTGAVGLVEAFGLVVMAKIHRSDFLSLRRGIYKSNPVASADVSVIDNSFLLCSQYAIALGGSRSQVLLAFLPQIVSLRHLIQSNAFAVQGFALATLAPLTFFEQNTVQCKGAIAVEVNAEACSVKNNVVYCLATEAATGGLLTFAGDANNIRIAGNQLINAAGHAIVFIDDVSVIAIEDNVIERAKLTAIGTLHDGVRLQRLNIARNRIERCQGNVPEGATQIGGAVAIADALDVQVMDNAITNNSPIRQVNNFWFALYFGSGDAIQIRGNKVNDNGRTAGPGPIMGAVLLREVGTAAFQGNMVIGNGGLGLEILAVGTAVSKRVMIQNNHFVAGPNMRPFFVRAIAQDSLVFEGNQCFRAPNPAGFQSGIDVQVSSIRATVSGNSIEASSSSGLTVSGNRLVVTSNSVQSTGLISLQATAMGAPGPVALVLSSNLATGFIAGSSSGLLNRVGNIPGP